MTYCNVCRRHVDGVKFIKSPKCLQKRALWEDSLGCKLGDYSKICETHFGSSQWKSTTQRGGTLKKRRLNEDAVPQREPELNIQKLGYADSSTQTEDNIIGSTMLVENKSLRKRIREMEKENRSFCQQLEEYKELEMSLAQIFTETQIKILKSGGKRATFNSKDISAAICLHTAGPHAYTHLYKKGYPLPSRATLYRWLADEPIKTGTLDFVMDLMENEEMLEVDKLCVLSFDKINISADHSSADIVDKPNNYVQLVIVRGLKKSWNQPVFFDFDTQMNADILNDIIRKLHIRGYPVVAIVSDFSSENQMLWSQLGISETKTWFSNPADDKLNIYVFSDTPHLIKLIRIHYIDSGLVINGKILTTKTIRQAISACDEIIESALLPEITENHYSVGSLGEQNVKLATQLFSNATAKYIRSASLRYEVENACETADLFKVFNDWYDVFNSIEKTQPYGKQIEVQRAVLTKMTEIMRNDIVGKAQRLPFQNGILVNNASLDGLLAYLSKNYQMDYIVTSRLNQDIFETFFGPMQASGGQNDHPTALQFKQRIRKYIAGMTKLKKNN